MGIVESIQKGFNLAGKSPFLISLLFVFGFIFNIINLTLAPKTPETGTSSPLLIIAGIIFILLTIFFQAGSIGYIRDKIKTGAATFSDFTSSGGKYYLRLLVLGLLVSLIIGVFVLLAALAVSFFKGNLLALGVLLAIVFGTLGIYFVVMLFLSPYVVVADDKTVKESIQISMRLVKKNILSLLGISVLLIVIGFVIGLVLGVVFAGVSYLIKQGMISQALFALLSSLANAYLSVMVTAAFMNFYLSLADRNNTPA